ncbi:hypothetical protein Pmani_019202 [Petrolisthes manimaculis]|uniref:Uncharacterized protein n=1 Tax=Petrolisthes manimaculis TaxID=1843537 RepID=A0AAE1PJC7_9EUCA|nr:hypothetical protein Pmani_019202 [Petrolisthes manimaculis]
MWTGCLIADFAQRLVFFRQKFRCCICSPWLILLAHDIGKKSGKENIAWIELAGTPLAEARTHRVLGPAAPLRRAAGFIISVAGVWWEGVVVCGVSS